MIIKIKTLPIIDLNLGVGDFNTQIVMGSETKIEK